ncbi:MAG TPA: hypothetical protein VHO24_12345 [Opitutaceae bacterium]|nr:hypothetical protein [Opitutaceae bacterium]
MQIYHGANSGVSAYQIGSDFIVVQFRSGEGYLYNHLSPGRRHVTAMKKLAVRNEGLATYISRHVRENYAEKLA